MLYDFFKEIHGMSFYITSGKYDNEYFNSAQIGNLESNYLYSIFRSNFEEILINFNFNTKGKTIVNSYLKLNINNEIISNIVLVEELDCSSLFRKMQTFSDKNDINFKYINLHEVKKSVNYANFKLPFKLDSHFARISTTPNKEISIANIKLSNFKWDKKWKIAITFRISLYKHIISNYVIKCNIDDVDKNINEFKSIMFDKNRVMKSSFNEINNLYKTKNFRIESKNLNVNEIIENFKKYNQIDSSNEFYYDILKLIAKNFFRISEDIIEYDIKLRKRTIIFPVSKNSDFIFAYDISEDDYNNFPIFKNIFNKCFTDDIINNVIEFELKP